MTGFYKHAFKVLLHVTIFRATSLATEICCKFNAQCYTLQLPCNLSREKNCVSDCLTIESRAKQVARAIVHVVSLCNLKKFIIIIIIILIKYLYSANILKVQKRFTEVTLKILKTLLKK